MEKVVMVTGASGYIGSWVVKELLEKGYTVRATVRDKNKTSKTKPLTDLAVGSAGKLELWEADLMKAGSFDEAAKGCESIMHIASPFTLRFKDAKKELIDPALEGTRNVLNAANKSGTVKKVVLTSSAAAVYGDNLDMKEKGLDKFTEEQFNETSSQDHQPYSYSKLLAEKEAWKIHDTQEQWKLVVINPTFVVGPSLTGASDSESINLMKDMLSGKYAMGTPELWFGFVDVRDVAHAHIIALEDPNASGRHILAERTMSLLDLAQMLRSLYGNKYKLPKSSFPKFIFYLFGPFMGIKAKFISRNVGYPIEFDTSKSRTRLKLNYTPIEKSMGDMVEQMHELNLV